MASNKNIFPNFNRSRESLLHQCSQNNVNFCCKVKWKQKKKRRSFDIACDELKLSFLHTRWIMSRKLGIIISVNKQLELHGEQSKDRRRRIKDRLRRLWTQLDNSQNIAQIVFNPQSLSTSRHRDTHKIDLPYTMSRWNLNLSFLMFYLPDSSILISPISSHRLDDGSRIKAMVCERLEDSREVIAQLRMGNNDF